MRYDLSNAPSFVHEDHARRKGIWTQYAGLTTPLRGRVFYSDVIKPGDQWTDYKGNAVEIFDLNDQTPENYHGSHNHYQLALFEVLNTSPGTNAIPIWGDGNAIANQSSAWGAFFSARSAKIQPDYHHDDAYPTELLEALPSYDDFDAQLCGLEVDVLNNGKPGVFGNKAKHGIQVVGFGNPNSHALSVICENFDCPPEMQKGQFESGVYFQSSIHPEYGRMIVADFDKAHIGVDFRKPVFDWGAIQLNAPRAGTGVVFSEGRGGEIYSGPRQQDGLDVLTMRMGADGFRILNAEGTKEVLSIDSHGALCFNGEVYLKGCRPTIFDRIANWLNRVFLRC